MVISGLIPMTAQGRRWQRSSQLMRRWRVPKFLSDHAFRGLRWLCIAAILAFCLIGLYRGSFDVCTVETTTAADGQVVKKTCEGPAVTDASVVATALLLLLLAVPDVSEIDAFGVSLKRRV